jgi:predicted TIM-barrel fold metal-dependent hydrolase
MGRLGALAAQMEVGMKDGMRFVDSDMHVQEPGDLFVRYLDPAFRHRITTPVNARGRYARAWVVDGLPSSRDAEVQQYRKRARRPDSQTTGVTTVGQQQSNARSTGRLDFAVQRDYDPDAQLMAFDMEGVDIAVLFPTGGLSILGRDGMDPQLSLAIAQAYNNWISEFCSASPERMRFAAMLPAHDVNLACAELVRAVRELGAAGSFLRPNLLNGHYWHSNYWDPLYSLHEELGVPLCFHEGTGAWNSHMDTLYGENRFYRHVMSHWIEMQQTLAAMLIGGVFEFHPNLRVAYLEAGSSWAPGLLSRIEWDYVQYRETHAPYLSLTPKEYFQRNCWASVEGSEPEIAATAASLGADRLLISTDYPHFDSNFPNVANTLIGNVGAGIAAPILKGGAGLYGFTDEDFARADAAAERDRARLGTAR